jgi:phage shock protein A
LEAAERRLVECSQEVAAQHIRADEAERRAQEAEHGIARWEVYAQGLEAQVRSVREAALREASDAIEMLERNMNYGPSVADALAVLRALSSSPVSSQREPKA